MLAISRCAAPVRKKLPFTLREASRRLCLAAQSIRYSALRIPIMSCTSLSLYILFVASQGSLTSVYSIYVVYIYSLFCFCSFGCVGHALRGASDSSACASAKHTTRARIEVHVGDGLTVSWHVPFCCVLCYVFNVRQMEHVQSGRGRLGCCACLSMQNACNTYSVAIWSQVLQVSSPHLLCWLVGVGLFSFPP